MDWRAEVRNEFARLGKRPDDSVVEELSQHAAAAFESAKADGAPVDDAAARVRALIASWCAATDGPRRTERAPLVESAPASRSMFAGIGLDLRHAMRVLKRQPGFTAVSILMIALAVGATTTLFSIVNGVLLKPLPWPNADRLIRVSETREGSTSAITGAFLNSTYNAWVSSASTIDGIGAFSNQRVVIEADTERVQRTAVSASLFPLLGVQPFVGSGFTKAHEQDQAFAILSYSLWQERFGGAADVVGKSMRVDRRPFTIVGVMPRGFEFPDETTQFWTPYLVSETKPNSVNMFNAIALMKPNVAIEQARAEAEARSRSVTNMGMVVKAVFGTDGAPKVSARSLADSITGDVRPALWVLLAAVGLLFAAAIGNVANMQLAQAAGRSREVAIRAAIGAGAGRLARQLFIETAVTSIAGGTLGLLLTVALLRLAPSMLPADFPRMNMVRIDTLVLVSVFVLIALVTIATGLLPVRLARRLAVRGALSEDGVGTTLTSPVARSRALIITAQVAIAAVLLVGAALLSRSFVTLLKVDRGYEPSHVMTARVLMPGTGGRPAVRKEFFDALLGRLRGLPGVTHVGLTNALPLTGGDFLIAFSKHANPLPGDTETVHATLRPMTADYFNAIGMKVVQGRGFSDSDTVTSEPVLLVNRTFERANFTGSAIDQTLPAGIDDKRPEGTPWRIVGVVDDVRHRGAAEPVQPEIYACMCQITDGPTPAEYVTVRTTRDPAELARGFREFVRSVNPAAIVEQTMTMEDRLLRSLARPRLYAVLLGGFAVFALLISGIGLFGGLSYGVTQRTREIGLRSALGATPGEIVLLIVRQGLTVAGVGLAAGIAVALLSTRVLAGFLYGVATRDAASFAGVAALLLLTSILACAIPARRAARIDVMRALKR